ncbi:MAG: sugar ABC transporter ATP-binding protein [Candidatus Poribacteria bacterium]|nr:sugar ABC transporter ATP-binding protein [Candidatus Poribacteria bacterium]
MTSPAPPHVLPHVEMRAIRKEFGGVVALADVTFTVAQGEIHALCGENGAGKSTLIKVLGGVGEYGTYGGELRVNDEAQRFRHVRDAQRAGIAVIHQELALVPEMTVAENLCLGREPTRRGVIDRRRVRDNARDALGQIGLNVDPDIRVNRLGIGAQQLIEIAKALTENAQILVLDEPTAALTESEAETLFAILETLRERGVTIIYISHRLDEVFRLADRVTVLRDGESVGTWRRGEIDASGLIEQMVGRQLTTLFPKTRRDRTGTPPVALEVEHLTARTATGSARLEDISFQAYEGEILGIAGLMGAGRTELLLTLFGAWESAVCGAVRLFGKSARFRHPREAIRRGVAMVSEDRKRFGLILDASVERNLTLASLGAMTRWGIVKQEVSQVKASQSIERMRVRTSSLSTLVNSLSGGNQQKIALGKWLMTEPRVLLLDEPTRGVDVGAKAEIHEQMNALAQSGVTILMASSELPELLGMSDRILVLHEGRVSGYFEDARGVTQADILSCATGRTSDRTEGAHAG